MNQVFRLQLGIRVLRGHQASLSTGLVAGRDSQHSLAPVRREDLAPGSPSPVAPCTVATAARIG